MKQEKSPNINNQKDTVVKKSSYRGLVVFNSMFVLIYIVFYIFMGDSDDWSLIPLVVGDLVFCIIYMLIHGVAIYCVYRRILYPNLITGAFVLLSIVVVLVYPYGNKQNAIGLSVYLCGFFLVSVFLSLLTCLIFKIMHIFRHTNNH